MSDDELCDSRLVAGELVAALEQAVTAYRTRHTAPPPPLFVPEWMVNIAELELGSPEAAHEWLDREARLYGYDGYTVWDSL